ncbi:hypothetical protein EYF80_038404 [Liparis tanakae]|uniref:Uncharacterized protein n=1 Tax=Liparis tanakae TaxID=230148 RepID=A0A4Z2GCS5_9TELE|nr:hypothetical protein EYF80_038404 [Liparis tanakae]
MPGLTSATLSETWTTRMETSPAPMWLWRFRKSFTLISNNSTTHVCCWVGSSPKETVSPWISLKHFSQKWYLSATSPNFGELHRSPAAQSITDSAREGSHPLAQDMGEAGCHKCEQAGSGRAGQQEVVIATASHDSEG